ncbi:MAG: DUF4339 domain-containing protein [Akkermansia sp.]
MSEYFLKLPGIPSRELSEYEVREFLGQGVIDSKTLTWKQGMEGWRPSCNSSANVTYMEGNTRSEQRSTRGAAVPLALSFKRASQIIHFGMFRIAALHALEQLDCFPTMSLIMKKFRHSFSRIWFTCHLCGAIGLPPQYPVHSIPAYPADLAVPGICQYSEFQVQEFGSLHSLAFF